jgi:hypothetical protein
LWRRPRPKLGCGAKERRRTFTKTLRANYVRGFLATMRFKICFFHSQIKSVNTKTDNKILIL